MLGEFVLVDEAGDKVLSHPGWAVCARHLDGLILGVIDAYPEGSLELKGVH